MLNSLGYSCTFNLKQNDSHSMFCTVNCFWLSSISDKYIWPDSVAKRFQNRSISLEYTKRPKSSELLGALPLEPTPNYSHLASLATLRLFLIGPLKEKKKKKKRKKRFRGPCKNLSTAISQTQLCPIISKLSIKLNLPFSLQQAYFHAKIIIHVPFNLKQSDSHSIFCTVNCYDSDSSLASNMSQSDSPMMGEKGKIQ